MPSRNRTVMLKRGHKVPAAQLGTRDLVGLHLLAALAGFDRNRPRRAQRDQHFWVHTYADAGFGHLGVRTAVLYQQLALRRLAEQVLVDLRNPA